MINHLHALFLSQIGKIKPKTISRYCPFKDDVSVILLLGVLSLCPS
jgi:hypothetical protein